MSFKSKCIDDHIKSDSDPETERLLYMHIFLKLNQCLRMSAKHFQKRRTELNADLGL